MSSRVFGHDLGHVFFQPGSHGAKRPSCGIRAGFVREFRQGVQQSVRGVQQGGEQNRFLLFRFFGKSKRTLGASKVSKWTFHFNSLSMKSLFDTGSGSMSADLATTSASAPAQLRLSVTVLCSGLHVPRTAGDRVAFFVDTRRRKVVLFERFSRKVLQFCSAEYIAHFVIFYSRRKFRRDFRNRVVVALQVFKRTR